MAVAGTLWELKEEISESVSCFTHVQLIESLLYFNIELYGGQEKKNCKTNRRNIRKSRGRCGKQGGNYFQNQTIVSIQQRKKTQK